jgi:uncharacterized damage-inducible protein DinB
MGDKQELLDDLKAARVELRLAIEGLSEKQMIRSDVVGEWSVKDTLAHIVAWDKEICAVVHAFVAQENPVFDYKISGKQGFAKWNAREVEKRRDLSVAQVLAEMEEARRELVELVQGLTDEQLSREVVPPWRRPKTVGRNVEILAEHDREHTEQITAWREQVEP